MNYKQYIQEAPLAYDTETKSYAKKDMMDIRTKTKWSNKLPPTDATIEEITQWVKEQQKNGTVDSVEYGGGATKTVLMNDNKTVFKYSDSSMVSDLPWLDDITHQIQTEVKIYKSSIGKTYKKILPKLYASGKHWMIQQYVPFVGVEMEPKFKEVFGIAFKDFSKLVYNEIFARKYSQEAITDVKWKLKDLGEKAKPLNDMIDFGVVTKSLGDFKKNNIGMDEKGNIYMIDFGLAGR